MEDESEESGSEIDSDEDDDEQTATAGQPYLSLMKSLAESAPHKTKRRKLDHGGEEEVQPLNETTIPGVDMDEDGDEAEAKDIDEVDEEEESPADADQEEVLDEDDEDDADTSDPFETHFAEPDDKMVEPRLKAIQEQSWRTDRALVKSTRVLFTTPDVKDEGPSATPKPISGVADIKLKQKLQESLGTKHAKFDEVEQTIAPYLFNYNDLLYCNRTASGGKSVRRMACLHALNHVFKTRDKVIKNTTKLAKNQGKEDLEFKDQGFTRPKVLVILPTRNSCVKMVEMICSLVQPDQQENRKRFDDSYVEKANKFSDDKPEDFRDLFAGNDDDMFRLGLKFTRKTIKYFSQFYNSDIIFGSPLGLRMAIGSEEEKKMDFDFLSSIELVIMDQADALLMQNWEHVEYVFEHLNLQPTSDHGCDFSRVRNWYLEDQAKHFRQTIIFSAFNTPELSNLVRTHCSNWAGKARLQEAYPGVIQHLGVKARQTFNRFDVSSVADEPDARFDYFTKAILPALAKRAKDMSGTLIFIPSYLDFVRVRNYFANDSAAESITFGTISEYADVPEASRARSHFLNGRHRVLLYTERAHHFRRYTIKGVKRVIMYALPDNPLFYQEIAGGYLQKSEQSLLLEPGQGTVRVMFSRYDVMKLEKVVGSQRVGKMISEQGDTFDFL
ncbi:hypothetical protein QBC39DRAFT_339060 [Podospora conica]|nr:hypothetical protein QBC39DRAFT_339060 [Schizothecium conicum]